MDGKLKAAAIVILGGLIACLCVSAQILNVIIGTAGSGAGQSFTYYVSQSTGSDSNPGTITQPFQTISKVNGLILTAGQSVGFKSGDTWRETLIPSTSGSSGSPITFASYGTGAQPIIAASDLVSGWTQGLTGWTAYSNTTVQNSFLTNNSQAINVGNATSQERWGQTFTPASSYSVSNIIMSLQKSGSPTDNVWVEIWTDSSGSPGAIVTNGQSNVISGASITTTPTNTTFIFAVSPSLTSGTPYWIVSRRTADTVDSVNFYKFGGVVSGGTGAKSFTPWAVRSGVEMYYQVIGGSAVPNVYQAPIPSSPTNLTFDGTTGTQEGSIAALTADNEWFWSSNVLYVYSATSPTGRVITPQSNLWTAAVAAQPNEVWFNGASGIPQASYSALTASLAWFWNTGILYVYSTSTPTSVESADRNYAVQVNQSYIAINGLHLFGSNGLADILVGNGSVFSGNQVLNCEINAGQSAGVYLWNQSGGVAQGNNIHDIWNGVTYAASGSGNGVVVFGSSAANNVITKNTMSNNFRGVFLFGSSGAQSPLGTIVSYNVVSNNYVNGIDQFQVNAASSPTLIANNTVIHNPQSGSSWQAGHGIDIQDTGSNGWVAENNLVYSPYTGTPTNVEEVSISSTLSLTSISVDYNDYFVAAGGTSYIAQDNSGTKYSTLSSWQTFLNGTTYSGKDAHSISADPLFVNFAGGNYALQPGSPAINTGTCITGVTPCPTNIGAK